MSSLRPALVLGLLVASGAVVASSGVVPTVVRPPPATSVLEPSGPLEKAGVVARATTSASGASHPSPRPPSAGSTTRRTSASSRTSSGDARVPALGTTTPRWQWPVAPHGQVVRAFRAPSSPWGAGHRGLDLAAPTGSEVRAVEAGVVTHAAVLAGRGTVTVRHRNGLRSTYEPVVLGVAAGAAVATGDLLGRLAPGGHCGSTPCLHVGALRDSGYLDPWPLLVGGRVRLLPLGHP